MRLLFTGAGYALLVATQQYDSQLDRVSTGSGSDLVKR